MSRELEKKFVINSPRSQSDIDKAIDGAFDAQITRGFDLDVYWNAPENTVDFIRLRRAGGDTQLTVKKTDRGSNEDRLEVNVSVPTYQDAEEYLLLVHGEPVGEVAKTYTKYKTWDNEISVYRVIGDDRLFLEVESKDSVSLEVAVARLETILSLTREPKSIYQLFLQNKETK